MARTKILIDSNFLFALLDRSSPDYAKSQRVLLNNGAEYLIPQVVLTEAAFLFRRRGGVPAVEAFLAGLLLLKFPFVAVTEADVARARSIMLAYPTSRLDFVDCCIGALAERMNITQICTYDRRDFGIMRPRHVESFTLLP